MGNTLLIHFARYVTLMGGDERDIGYIAGVATIGAFVLRPWMGRCIDVLGARTTWAGGYTVFIGATVALLAIDDIGPSLYLLRFVGTLAFSFIFASMLTYLSHTTEPRRLAEAIGSVGAGGFIGMIVGPALGDLFVGEVTRTWTDFVWLFGTASGLVAISLCLIPFLQSAPAHPDARQAPFFKSIYRHWPGMILLIAFAFGMCMAGIFAFLPDFADNREIHHVGGFFVVYGTWAILLRIVFRTLPQRIGRRRQLMIGMGFMAAGIFSFVWVDHAAMLVLPALLCGTGHSLGFHALMAAAVESFPQPLRGLGTSIVLMTFDAGGMIGAPLLGVLAKRYDYGTAYLCVSVFVTVSLVLYFCRLRLSKSAVPPLLQAEVVERSPED